MLALHLTVSRFSVPWDIDRIRTFLYLEKYFSCASHFKNVTQVSLLLAKGSNINIRGGILHLTIVAFKSSNLYCEQSELFFKELLFPFLALLL